MPTAGKALTASVLMPDKFPRHRSQGIEVKNTRRKEISYHPLLVLVFIFATLFSGACTFKTGHEYLITGNEYFKAGDLNKAEKEYREALRLEPESSIAHNNLGVVLNELGQYQEAITILTRAIEIDPKNAIAHYALANSLSHTGRYDDAMVQAAKAIELEETEPQAHKAMAEAAQGKGDFPTALQHWNYLVQLDPDNDELHHSLADVYGKAGNLDEQIAQEEKALSLNKYNVDARIGLAKALMAKGERQRAARELKELLGYYPDNKNARRLLETIEAGGSGEEDQTALGTKGTDS